MARLDIEFVRAQFPAFREPSLEDFAHFENAGGSWACGQVITALERYYSENKLQPYYPSVPSRRAGEQMDSARRRLAEWLNVGADELHFGPSTSQNTYVIAQALRGVLKPGDEIVVTNQDHESNIGAWRRLADAGVVVREWQVEPDTGELRIEDLDRLLGARTRVVAFTHCSNVIGTINPVRAITDRIHAAGALAIVDGVGFCPHGLPDVAALGADLYLFSLYKVYGPHLGVMYLRRELNADWPNQGHFFNAGKPGARFVPAGPDHAQIAAVNGLMDYLDAVAERHELGGKPPSERAAGVAGLFRTQESELLQPLLDFVSQHPRLRLLGHRHSVPRAPTVATVVDGARPIELAERLAALGLGVGAGHFYAYRLLQALGIDTERGVLRASFVHYTSPQEVSWLIAALDQLA